MYFNLKYFVFFWSLVLLCFLFYKYFFYTESFLFEETLFFFKIKEHLLKFEELGIRSEMKRKMENSSRIFLFALLFFYHNDDTDDET